ncbi:MAG: SDR family oxidoreductase [Isosphaeraceae bacterium]
MRVLLTGASGQLGSYLVDRLRTTGHDLIAWSGTTLGERAGVVLKPVNLADPEAIDLALEDANPELILHAAALSSPDAVRLDPDGGQAVNVRATEHLADWCRRHNRRLVYTSTDLVFDGNRPWNQEDDPAEPILAYGRTKLQGEPAVLATPFGLVARLSLLFGPSQTGQPSYFDHTIDGLRRGQTQTLLEDEFRTPLHYANAADLLVRLAESSATGLVHVGGPERVSRFDLIRRVAARLGFDPGLVLANRRADLNLPEVRPADVSLDTQRLARLLPDAPRLTIDNAILLIYINH